MPPSSSGSGHLSFKEAAGIRLPLGVGYYERKWIILLIIILLIINKSGIDSSWVDARAVNGDGL